MSNKDDQEINIEVDVTCWPIALVLWVIFVWGDPDLLDALIHYFMR